VPLLHADAEDAAAMKAALQRPEPAAAPTNPTPAGQPSGTCQALRAPLRSGPVLLEDGCATEFIALLLGVCQACAVCRPEPGGWAGWADVMAWPIGAAF
jgi:hypothetical protein